MIAGEDLASLRDHFASNIERSKTTQIVNVDTKESSQESRTPSILAYDSTVVTTKVGWRFLTAFACLCLVNLVCAIDATIVAVALPVSS